MDSKNYIRACALFCLSQQGYKRIISRGCHDWADLRTVVCPIQRRRPVSPGPSAHWTPSKPRSSIFEGSSRRSFGRDKPEIGNQVRMLSANKNQIKLKNRHNFLLNLITYLCRIYFFTCTLLSLQFKCTSWESTRSTVSKFTLISNITQ